MELEGELNGAKNQLNELSMEEAEQVRELRDLEDDSNKLHSDMKVLEDDNKYLEGVQRRLMSQVGGLEDEFASKKSKQRDIIKRLENLKRMKKTYEDELTVNMNDNSDLRRDRTDTIKGSDMREIDLNDLRMKAREFEKDLSECEFKSEEQIRELQNQKNIYNEQVTKTSALYDELNQLEHETHLVKADLEGATSSFHSYEDKKTGSIA